MPCTATYRDWYIVIYVASVQFSFEAEHCMRLVDESFEEDVVLRHVKDGLAITVFLYVTILKGKKQKNENFTKTSMYINS